MRAISSSPALAVLPTLAAAGAFGLVLLASTSHAQTVPATNTQAALINPPPAKLPAVAEDNSIRPFRVHVSEEALVDLRRRIGVTRWTDRDHKLIYFHEVDKGGHFYGVGTAGTLQ